MWSSKHSLALAVTVFSMVLSLALAWAGYLFALCPMFLGGVVLLARGIVLNWGAYTKYSETPKSLSDKKVVPVVPASAPVRVRVMFTPYRVANETV